MRDRLRTAYRIGSPRARLWQSMRILRGFQVPDLAATADCKPCTVRAYLGALVKAGHVVAARRPVGCYDDYRLARDTGPRAPRVWPTKRAVYDANTRRTHSFGGRA